NLQFVIESNSGPPVFNTHPASQTVALGGNVTFTVAVSGAPPPALQWRKDNVNLPGQTGTTLTLNGVTLESAGSYDCVATNDEGSATSNPATLTVEAPPAPTITTQPLPIRSLAGSGAF